MENPERVTYFAATQARGKRTPFGIKAKDRARHIYALGKTGTGKTTLLENLAIQDIRNGEGLAFIDIHGASCEKLLDYVPKERIRDVVYVTKETSLDYRRIMDEGKILFIRLPKGEMSEEELRTLGSAFVDRIVAAATGRIEGGAARLEHLPLFHVYIDEFPAIAGPTLVRALSEARKYKLAFVLSHQYLAQLSPGLSAAIFGNIGTLIAFRVGQDDAEALEKVFAPEFTREDLVNLGRCHIVLSLMIDHVGSRPFRATTIPPIEPPRISYAAEAKAGNDAYVLTPLTESVREAQTQAAAEREAEAAAKQAQLSEAVDAATTHAPFEVPEQDLRAVFKEDV